MAILRHKQTQCRRSCGNASDARHRQETITITNQSTCNNRHGTKGLETMADLEDERRKDERETMSKLAIEKERWNESKYRALYSDLLQKHRGLLSGSDSPSTAADEKLDDFREESDIMKTALTTERDAILYGVAVGFASFVSLRYFPKYMIWRIGGENKLKALKDADAKAKVHNGGIIGKATALFVESFFGIWVGTKAYEHSSRLSEGSYELISQIPLTAGRSALSDKLCEPWIDISQRQVPPAFWKNVDNENLLKDKRAWQAIRTFSENCIKRNKYESIVRETRGITNSKEPVVLPTKVPSNILSLEEAENLVRDAS